MGPEVLAAGAVAASIGGLALNSYGQVKKGEGEQASQEFLAGRDKRAAEIGRIRADQTDVALREELGTTLANIDAIRAAGNIDPLSPTTAAIKAEESRVSDRERLTRVASLRAQASEDELSADYRRKVGKQALLGGYVGAGATALSGLGKIQFGSPK